MNPMPSGGAGEAGAKSLGAASVDAGLAQEGADLSGAGTVGKVGAAGTGETLGCAGACAEAAMQATAAIGHGRLAALAAAAGAGAAARGGQEVAGRVAVSQPAAAVKCERSARCQDRMMNPMPSGGGAVRQGSPGSDKFRK